MAYLVRPPEVVEQTGVDTGARSLQRLRPVAPLRLNVEDYRPFLASHHTFYVYGPASWLVPQLLRDGATVQMVAQSRDGGLYRISRQ
jgi:hypothetical protein